MTDNTQKKSKPVSLRPDLEPTIRKLPTGSGVYLFRDKRGRVLYVGKAANLRSRVRSYFREKGDGRASVPILRRHVDSIETILADSEREALLLEDALIKDHAPRYNIRLRDDKSFLFIRLRQDHSWPYVQVLRRPKKDGNPTYGPFPSAFAARQTVKELHAIFPLRTCSNNKFAHRSRPCLDHQIGRCPAPCVGLISDEAYQDMVDGARKFLAGDRSELKRQLKDNMAKAAADLRYEDAARYRDRLTALDETAEKKTVLRFGRGSADAWGVSGDQQHAAISILHSIQGQLFDTQTFPGLSANAGQIELAPVILQYYQDGRLIPETILVQDLPPDAELVQSILSERRGKQVNLLAPQRGDRARLLQLAVRNAQAAFNSRDTSSYAEVARYLEQKLRLPREPVEIECYDVSVHQGAEPVGVVVHFSHGNEDKNRRRRYRLQAGDGQGDVQWMQEMLTRRLQRGIREDTLPDLIVLDGGIAQLNGVLAVMKELEIEWQRVPVVALAKARTDYGNDDQEDASSERIFLPGRRNPVVLNPGSGVFNLMVSIRDATHAGAIGYHRRRGRSRLLAGLEQIDGMGPARRASLLETYPDLAAVADQTADRIARAAGIPENVAARVLRRIQELQADGGLDTLNPAESDS